MHPIGKIGDIKLCLTKLPPESYIWGSSGTNLTEVAQIICVKMIGMLSQMILELILLKVTRLCSLEYS